MVELDPSVVERLVDDHQSIRNYLISNGEISFASALEQSVPKLATLSAASWIEDRLQKIVVELFEESMPDDAHHVAFVQNAGIERRYHTWFQWKSTNANSFFGLFGPDFKDFCEEQIRAAPELEADIKAFMELGRLRNTLVHENFAAFGLEKSVAEIDVLFNGAVRFLRVLPALLRNQSVTPYGSDQDEGLG